MGGCAEETRLVATVRASGQSIVYTYFFEKWKRMRILKFLPETQSSDSRHVLKFLSDTQSSVTKHSAGLLLCGVSPFAKLCVQITTREKNEHIYIQDRRIHLVPV